MIEAIGLGLANTEWGVSWINSTSLLIVYGLKVH